MDQKAARRLRAAEEIVEADRAQAEAQRVKPGPLTHDDLRAIVREEMGQEWKHFRYCQADALGAIDTIARNARDLNSAIGSLGELLNGLREALDCFGEAPHRVVIGSRLGADGGARRVASMAGGVAVGHEISPLVDGCGHRTVRDSWIAGAEIDAPAIKVTTSPVSVVSFGSRGVMLVGAGIAGFPSMEYLSDDEARALAADIIAATT
ncbi:hypothetical protein GS445_18075 [Rhodococcus hoagii]|uniref:hypothetical protein n=1 Tax=Rhodococcus hoagii TaxID=43767 RepID=UPI00197FC9B1|nr:hypothetical protein [Prescottella equi]MBM4551537.1 hypothetical protein [Prescottella equi]NKW16889.1 hypothetical protein [Prescottella equi]NKZ94668.1 hypothetical protein [Prescottella equi]